MDETGYYFVGDKCAADTKKCRVHVSLHGCDGGRFMIGDTYAKNTGYLEWGHNMLIIFP